MYGEALLRQQLRKFPPAALLVLLFSSYFLGFECVCVCAPHASTLRKKRAHHMYRRGGGGGGGCLQGGEGDRHGKIKREEIGRSYLLDIFLPVPTFEEASLFCPPRPAHPGASVSSLSVSLRRGEPPWKNRNTLK